MRGPFTQAPLLGLQTVAAATHVLSGILRRLAPSVLQEISQDSGRPDNCRAPRPEPVSPQPAQPSDFAKVSTSLQAALAVWPA